MALDTSSSLSVSPALIVTRAARGQYSPDVLARSDVKLPQLGKGDILVDVLLLSIDPTNRNWLKLEPTNTLVEKVGHRLEIGSPMLGEAIVRVVSSQHPNVSQGDLLAGIVPWQERAVVPADRLRAVDWLNDEPLAAHLTIFSHIGMAAMAGLHDVARIQAGETVLISAAAGATGRVATAVAKAAGCRVVAIAGGPEKCAEVHAYGADAAVDYKNSDDLTAAIAEAAPEGVDVYFDNVGGKILDAALMNMKRGGRVAVCGVMADYDNPDATGVRNMFQVLIRHLRIEGFLAAHFWDKRDTYYEHLRSLIRQGVLTHAAETTDGLDSAPEQLSKLFQGTNRAKLLVDVAGVEATIDGTLK